MKIIRSIRIEIFTSLIFLTLNSNINAGTVLNKSHSSTLLQMNVSYTVILPDDYDQQVAGGKQYPVVYLLHCATCSKSDWTSEAMAQDYINDVNFIAIAPDDGGGRDSWWVDSPVNANWKYSSYLADELKPHIDSEYATLTSREFNGICGHSMGGFGALHNLIEHPDVYGSAFSIKGCVDIMPYDSKYGLNSALGDQSTHYDDWVAVNPVTHICELKDWDVHIGFYSGPVDKFHNVNADLHDTLVSCDIEHLYYTNGENHYTVPPASMKDVMGFFDSVFTLSTSEIRFEKYQTNFSSGELTLKNINGKTYNIRGQCVKDNIFSGRNSKGIYVNLHINSSGNKKHSLIPIID